MVDTSVKEGVSSARELKESSYSRTVGNSLTLFKIVHYAHLLYIYIYIYIFFQLVIGTIVSVSYFNYRLVSVFPCTITTC